MMNYILFDGNERNNFLPLTFTRPIADLRIGILTIREKWEKVLETVTSTKTEDYLNGKWPLNLEKENVFINSSFIPTPALVSEIKNLKAGEKLVVGDEIISYFQEGSKEKDLKSA